MGEQIGGILIYETSGRGGICGTTVGADGAGTFSLVIYGSSEDAETYIRDYLTRMKEFGYRDLKFMMVLNEELFVGPAIKQVVLPSANQTPTNEMVPDASSCDHCHGTKKMKSFLTDVYFTCPFCEVKQPMLY